MKAMTAVVLVLLAGCAGSGTGGSPDEQERKMTGLLQKFDLWDDNGDGFLTEQEIADGLKAHGLRIDSTPAEVVAFYDRDGDKRISMSEAQAPLNL